MTARAAIRITLTAADLDEQGLVTDTARGRVRRLLCDVPARAHVTIDLGPLRSADWLLMRTLALLPCAESIVIESSDWRVAESAWLELVGAMAPSEVA